MRGGGLPRGAARRGGRPPGRGALPLARGQGPRRGRALGGLRRALVRCTADAEYGRGEDADFRARGVAHAGVPHFGPELAPEWRHADGPPARAPERRVLPETRSTAERQADRRTGRLPPLKIANRTEHPSYDCAHVIVNLAAPNVRPPFSCATGGRQARSVCARRFHMPAAFPRSTGYTCPSPLPMTRRSVDAAGAGHL